MGKKEIFIIFSIRDGKIEANPIYRIDVFVVIYKWVKKGNAIFKLSMSVQPI